MRFAILLKLYLCGVFTEKYSKETKISTMNFTLLNRLFFLFAFSIVVIWTSSCKKDIFDDNPSIKLSFSNDSVIFDTVFTSLGSATHRLMVYNPSTSKIKITSISLSGGSSSAFRINVDGEPGITIKDVEIAGGDSLFIFLRVTIDPTNANNPFVVENDLQFLTNGNSQAVKLIAWGQNAHYILADTYNTGFQPYKVVVDSLETVHWTPEKPYVIYGYAVIDSYGKLIIDAGTHVYFHSNSGLLAYSDAVLKIEGTLNNQVYFQGDRLEPEYSDLPGQWDRIWLMESQPGEDHEIKNAIIENGFIGIQAESFLHVTANKLILENVIIRNMSGMGIFSRVYNILGGNTVVANCGAYCMAFTGGGNYNFIQSTIADYWEYGIRKTPALFLNNFLLDSLENPIPIPMHFEMDNSIVYGFNNDEFGTEMVEGADSSYFFNHALMKTTKNVDDANLFESVIANEDPLFFNTDVNDYRLDSLSPAIDKGSENIASQLPNDILGNPRSTLPDLGAYEFEPGRGQK